MSRRLLTPILLLFLLASPRVSSVEVNKCCPPGGCVQKTGGGLDLDLENFEGVDESNPDQLVDVQVTLRDVGKPPCANGSKETYTIKQDPGKNCP